MTNTSFPNDFDKDDPDTTRWVLSEGKETVEDRRYVIRVSDLKKNWEWNYREDMHTQRPFLLGKIKVMAVKDKTYGDWYLELVEPNPRCTNTAISLKHSCCNYGGYREWFECPECSKRVGVLYRDENHFKCRKCLGLIYNLQKISYNGIRIVLENMLRLEKMEENKRRYFYKGKETKWFKKYKELNWKVGGGMNLYSAKYSKK